MNKFTEAPVKKWIIVNSRVNKRPAFISCDPDEQDAGTVICEINSSRSIQETLENAKKIAAVPQMWEAIIAVIRAANDGGVSMADLGGIAQSKCRDVVQQVTGKRP